MIFAAAASTSQILTSAPAAEVTRLCALGWKLSVSMRFEWPASVVMLAVVEPALVPSPSMAHSLTVWSSEPVASTLSSKGENLRSVTALLCAPSTSTSLSYLPGLATGRMPTEPPPPELYGNAISWVLAASSDDVSAPDVATCRSVYHFCCHSE